MPEPKTYDSSLLKLKEMKKKLVSFPLVSLDSYKKLKEVERELRSRLEKMDEE